MGPISNICPFMPSQMPKNLGWLLGAIIVAVLPGFFNDLPDLARQERDFFRVSVLLAVSGLSFIEVPLEYLGSMVVSVCNLTTESVDAYNLSCLFKDSVEYTLLCI